VDRCGLRRAQGIDALANSHPRQSWRAPSGRPRNDNGSPWVSSMKRRASLSGGTTGGGWRHMPAGSSSKTVAPLSGRLHFRFPAMVESMSWRTVAGRCKPHTDRSVLSGQELLMKVRLGRLLACLSLSILFATPCWSQSDHASEWRRAIVARIRATAHFPPAHSAQGGEARIAFKLDRSGKVTSAVIAKSAGLSELDQAALTAIEKAHFPSAPPEIEDSGLDFVAPFVFVSNEWLMKIIGQLRPHLHVPPGFTNKTGEASVDFTIDRSGKVISTKLVKSAGISELDTAALAAVEAAQPFPVPFEVDDSGLRIPVTFGFPSSTTADIEKAEENVKARLRGICRGC
jgi:protein TonB